LNPSELPAELRDALHGVRNRLGPLTSAPLYFPIIGSTNDVALSAGREGAVVIADEQSAGRGRRGHTWFSPAGSGLYVSVVLAPARASREADRAVRLQTIAAGVAIAEGIEASTGLRVALKWPNDLFLARRKLGGILAEATSQHADLVVVGYGLNVAAAAYPPDLADRVTSIETELGRRVDRFTVLAETLVAIASRYGDLLEGRFDAILDAWRGRSPGASGARVSWTDSAGEHRGVTDGVANDGALLVRVDGRQERIVAGTITWQ
jgi:BirA family biotin operon repressor/biotin-[acetyl-CoA-carboxylase] ligase